MPSPELLDRDTWLRGALPLMAPWLGLARLDYDSMPDGEVLRAARIHPDEPVYSLDQWRRVITYFATHSPIEPPPQPPRQTPHQIGSRFHIETWKLTEQPAFVSVLKVDPSRKRVLVGDGQEKSLRAVDANGQTLWRVPVPSGPVAVQRHQNRLIVTLIGRMFPSDQPAGQIWVLDDSQHPPHPTRLLAGLRRPVHTSIADVDHDGRDDLIVSAFGNRLGNLSWFQSLPGDPLFREHLLHEHPGTLRTLPLDWNKDGRIDIILLRAQAREVLEVLINHGNAGFQPVRLIEQPSTFGYSAMETADLDGDLIDEILLTNGDNGDYPSPHKAFHGLRIYQRTPDGLAERFFFPAFGAYGVSAGDFDADGDKDLVLISFFPDFNARPLESVVILYNRGSWRFDLFVLPTDAAARGRWLVVDSGDVDGDRDDDIVIGSFFRGPPTIPIETALEDAWRTNGISVMLLRNTLHRPPP
jgi:hypothetical protein